MSTPYEIPMTPEAQSFDIQLAGVLYHLRFAWNVIANCWVFDLQDASRVPIIQGIPVVTGIDLLGQYGYLNLGGAILAQTDHNADAVPTYQNFGLTGHIFFVVEP